MGMPSNRREARQPSDGESSSNHPSAPEMHPLILPSAPASEVGSVKAWEQPVAMVSHMLAEPDPNPMFLTKRVYQGSSGDVYP
jgi:hypothetical protein